ncbi:MAG: type I 3-dehydroquinate dehydratase [Lachnospiraceae bacterium]|nr:type I 3-dehydroquinate dehydratase [Lachnospiraceae bacterium]
MPVLIKGRLIDAKTPLICVPITDDTADGIISRAKKLVDAGVEMIEWRADFFEGISNNERVLEVLNLLREITPDTILIVTLRSRDQGGKCTMDQDERKALLITMAQAHSADLIDVEYFSYENPLRLIERLHERGALVVVSHHDFNETPTRAVMRELMSQMADVDGDIVKLAVMPTGMQDVSNLLSVTDWFASSHQGVPVITMSMGPMGVLSRIGGFMFGSAVTFAADGDAASAPGQLPYDDVESIIRILKKDPSLG